MKRMKWLRLQRGWSQAELGELAGVDPSAISLLESGDRRPMLATATALADALGCSERELLEEVE